MVSIEPLSAALGCAIEGIRITEALPDREFDVIETALDEHGVVVLRDQQVTPAAFVAFARRFGPPEPHVIEQFHHQDDPNILILSNVRRNGQPIGLADGGMYFHTDYSYLAVPARCTMLFAVQVPDSNAGTTFANQRAAYDDLPQETKDRIDGLICRHHYGNRDVRDESQRTAASPLTEDQKARMHWVEHRLVRPHPRTGRKCLYAVSGSSYGIEGMEHEEAIRLLDDLKTHATQPKYLHTHEYAPGDVVVWDNVQMLHRAPLTDPSVPRTLWRITVKESG